MTTPVNQEQASPVDAMAGLLASYSKSRAPSQRDMLMLALSLVQAVQRAAPHDEKVAGAFVQAFRSLAVLGLDKLQFPIMDTLLSNKYAALLETNNVPAADKHKVLLEGLFTFLTIAETQPASATEAMLYSAVEMVVAQRPAQKAAQPYPATNYRAALQQIFTPGNVAAVDLEPLQVIVYRGELLGGGFGPELWGLAYTKDATAHVLLETGEYITVPENSLTLAATKDYGTHELPPYLLACAKIFMPAMFGHIWGYNLPPELQQAAERLDKNFGSFIPAVQSMRFGAIPAEELAACENVIDSARWRMDDKQKGGAMKTISVANSCLQVVITAQQAAVRPYIVATLVDSTTHNVLLRLDTPREFTSKGVYLFPVDEKPTALVVL